MLHLFIDFDDTLSDMKQFVTQFTAAIAEYLQPKFGGEYEDWKTSARDMIFAIMEDYNSRFIDNPSSGYCDWLKNRHHFCSTLLFSAMTIDRPPDYLSISEATQLYALRKCNALYADAESALQELTDLGVKLHIASANDSEYLNAALEGAGIQKYFERIYGPDVIDCAKESPEFFALIFKHAGVLPDDSIVVDDKPEALQWAQQAGAKTIHVRIASPEESVNVPGVIGTISRLSDLPPLIKNELENAG